MSDQSAFVNTYLEQCMAALQERMQENLVHKTNLKLAQDSLVAKDATIADRDNTINLLIEKNNESVSTIKELESKAENTENLIQQIKDMKTGINSRDERLGVLEAENEKLKADINLRDAHIIKLDSRIKEFQSKLEPKKKAPSKKPPKKKAEPKLLVDHEIIPIEVNLEGSNQSTEANDF